MLRHCDLGLAVKIGDLAKKTEVSVDTLRYYEKIGLITDVERSESGYRQYGQHNIEQVYFIRNAQHSGFSLEEISQLLLFRVAPLEAKSKVRDLAAEKVQALSTRIDSLIALRDELSSLVNQCESSKSHCPIIDSFNEVHDTIQSRPK
jgi:DNA-binding transcriptional MerR regulator